MSNRSGFTLIEMIVALTLLTVVLLGMTTTTARLSRTAAESSQVTVALGLAQERLATIQMDPAYNLLEDRYEGSENDIDDFPGFARETTIRVISERLDSGRTLEYKEVTVVVEAPGLERPVRRTVTITRS